MPVTPEQCAAKSFGLPYLVDNGLAYGWPTDTERVCLLRYRDDDPGVAVHRLSDGLLLGFDVDKEEAIREAQYRLTVLRRERDAAARDSSDARKAS